MPTNTIIALPIKISQFVANHPISTLTVTIIALIAYDRISKTVHRKQKKFIK